MIAIEAITCQLDSSPVGALSMTHRAIVLQVLPLSLQCTNSGLRFGILEYPKGRPWSDAALEVESLQLPLASPLPQLL